MSDYGGNEQITQNTALASSISSSVTKFDKNKDHSGKDWPWQHRKQTHNVIEKRRRDKMNNYIMELASVIPSYSTNQTKFDKLTVLRMAVQHVKSLRSSLCSFSSLHLRPSFLSSGNLLKNLILQMASHEAQDNLFMVVTCDRGKVLFVSESSKDILNHEQHELVGQCLFDLLHKDDVSEVKEQISYFNLMPKEMLVDSKTLQPIKHNQRQSFSQLQNQANSMPQPGARRSFFCRMRSGRSVPTQSEDSKPSPSSSSSSSTASPTSTVSSSSPGSSSSLSSPPSSSLSPLTQSKQLQGAAGGVACDEVRKEDNLVMGTPITRSRQIREVIKSSNREICNKLAKGHNYLHNQATSLHPKQQQQNLTTCHKDRLSFKSATKNVADHDHETATESGAIMDDSEDLEISCKSDIDNHHHHHDQDNHCCSLRTGTSRAAAIEDYHKNDSRVTNNISNNNAERSNSKHKAKTKNQDSSEKLSSPSAAISSYIGPACGTENGDSGCNTSRSSRTSSCCVASNSSLASEQSPDNGSSQSETPSNNSKRDNNYTLKGPSKASSSRSTNSSSIQGSKKYRRYVVMHCTGYLKSVTLRNDEFDDDDFDDYNSDNNSSDEDENDGCRTVNCLVAVCRRSPMDIDLKPDRPLTFTCRYSMEGKFVFVDQRTTVALGYTPQQLLGTSHYAYCHKNSVNTFKECHSQSIQKSEPVSSDIYQFKRANGQHMWLQTSLKSFRNPWTKIIDYIVANHTTAEGNDPHYNEGCVPTKFNQDMTGGEGSQSFSPASSFTLSLPSMDSSKKSSSPSSSSIGSSYSMDSYASGACIQGLLNRIDRAKSSGIKYALDLHRKKSDNNLVRSNDNLARKNAESIENPPEIQTCSSLSFPNNLTPLDCPMSVPFSSYFGDGTYNENTISGNPSSNHQASIQKSGDCNIDGFRSAQNFAPANYQVQCQSMVSTDTRINNPQECKQNQVVIQNTSKHVMKGLKTTTRSTGKVARSMSNMMKQHNHTRHYDNQYHYRNQLKSGSSTSSDTGNESATWSNSSGSNRSIHHDTNQEASSARTTGIHGQIGSENGESPNLCRVPYQEQLCQTLQDKLSPYVMHQSVENGALSIVSTQVPIQAQMSGITGNQMSESRYPDMLMSVPSYVSQSVNAPNTYNDGMNLNQMQRMIGNLQPANQMTMTGQEHQQQSHVMPQQQHSQDGPNQMSMPMMWNPANNSTTSVNNENPYQSDNFMQNNHCQQICQDSGITLMNMDVMNTNNLLISQQKGPCQECANNKCSARQMTMTNNTDLNSADLTSLAVDGDLDEDQLIEYLAGCDPSYHMQNNNSFPSYNIYR